LAQRLAEELLFVSRQRNDSAGLILGHICSGRNLQVAGKFALSRSHLEAVIGLYNPISHRSLVHQAAFHPHVVAQGLLGLVLFCLGFSDQASATSNAAVAEARRLGHPSSLALSLAFDVTRLAFVGDNATLGERVDQIVAVAIEQGFTSWRAFGTAFRGWVNVKNGDVAEGISLLRSGLSAFRAAGSEAVVPHFLARLAAAYEIAGQVEEALAILDNALQVVGRTGEHWLDTELYRHKGELLLRRGQSEAAEDLYRKAWGIAREQGAKLWELRAAVSLARLRRDHGCRSEARDLLAPIYGWFTEGFDTRDLKEAKAFLDELA
jgi:predicted ATPase